MLCGGPVLRIGPLTANDQRLSAAARCLQESGNANAADKPFWTEPPP